MKRSTLVAAAGAVVLSFAMIAPVQAGVVGPMSTTAKAEMGTSLIEEVGRRGRRGYRHRRRGRNRGAAIGAGILALGIIGAIAASNRANSRSYYYDDRYERRRHYRNKCHRWLRRCRHGNDRSCWKYDTRC